MSAQAVEDDYGRQVAQVSQGSSRQTIAVATGYYQLVPVVEHQNPRNFGSNQRGQAYGNYRSSRAGVQVQAKKKLQNNYKSNGGANRPVYNQTSPSSYAKVNDVH